MRFRTASLALAALAACAPKEQAPMTPQAATYHGTEFAFAGPDTLAPGLTTVTFVNGGAAPHHMMLARFDSGKTMADLQAFMQANPTGVPDFLGWHGIAGAIEPGDSNRVTVDLPAGSYAALCFVTDSTGAPHLAKGMVKMITVAGEPHSAPVPTADVELHALDFSFTVPDTLMAGAHTFHAVNDGPQVHEFQFVRLNDGVTVEQFMAAAAQPNQPPPGRLMGGPGAYSRGQEAYWSATLTPGNWLILCFVPDPADGKPHVMKGMVKPFTVPAS